MIKVGIVGGTGYTGAELLRLFAQHPDAQVTVLTSRKEDGRRADALFPLLRGYCDLRFSAPDATDLSTCDVVFFATPHGTAMALTLTQVEKGIQPRDVSAACPLSDS